MMTEDRTISAMMRVRNEEEFLEAAVRSILEVVDEVVIVDNASTDGTPESIRTLQSELGSAVRAYEYPYEIRRIGRESVELSESDPTGDSPHLSATFYNFCLDKCTRPYVLKWDGDVVTLASMRDAIAAWRASGRPVMVNRGVNVHSDRRHMVAARSSDREVLLRQLEVPGLPGWVTSMTHTYPEVRLFPRLESRYEATLLWTQRLACPYTGPNSRSSDRFVVEEPCYLHLKFCKRDPFSNYSPDLAEVIRSNATVGQGLSEEHLEALQKWDLQA